MWNGFAKLMDRVRGSDIGWHEYLLVAALGVFVVLRLLYSLPRFSDGNIYLYLSYLVGEGAVPYRDFFYSSPLLIPYLGYMFGKVFSFSWRSFAAIPLLLTVIDAVVVYILARKFSRLGGLVSAVLYLLSFAVLATTDFVSDVHIVLTLALLGLLAVQKKKVVIGGGLLGLAVLAKLYAVVLVVGIGLLLVWRKRWRALFWYSLSWLIVFGGVMLGMWVWLGADFYSQVVTSHAGSVTGLDKRKILSFFAKHDWLLSIAPLAWLGLRKKVPDWLVIPLVVYLGFVLLWQDIYYLYLKVAVVWLALWWGWIVWQLQQNFDRKILTVVVLSGLVVVSGLSIWRYIDEQAEAAVVTDLNEMVEYVADISEEDDVLYGAFEVTPLIALGAERSIWKNMADTNVKFFQTGWFDVEQRMNEIREDMVPIIVTKALMTPGGQIAGGPDEVLPRQYFSEYCRVGKTWPIEWDYTHNAVIVWRCSYE